MSPDETDIKDTMYELDNYDKTVIVSLDVKYDTIVC
jgi:hypothetical protein